MKKIAGTTYIIAIHLLLFIVLLKSNFIEKVEIKLGMRESPMSAGSYYMDALGRYFANRSETMVDGDGLVFIGDSITNGLSVESIFYAVNFGISGDTVSRAKERVLHYRHLEGKTIVVALGVNDIPRKTAEIISDYRLLIERLPPSSLILLSSVLPLDESTFKDHWKTIMKTNHEIGQLNTALSELAANFPNAFYIDSSKYLKDVTGELKTAYHKGDGIHLSTEGYLMWVKGLREEFQKIVDEDRGGRALRRASL